MRDVLFFILGSFAVAFVGFVLPLFLLLLGTALGWL